MFQKCTVSIGITLATLSGTAFGDEFDGVVDSVASTAALSGSVEIHNNGILIGDFNAETNPTGTSTIPGLFGGSGNNPIDMQLTGAVNTDLNTNPTGSMVLDIDFDLLIIDIENLTLDLLGGQTGAAQPTVSMIYDTFRSVNPTFLYFGGIPFEFPIGDASTIDQAVATQTGPAAGVLVASGNPDVFDFTILIPAELAIELTLGFGDFQPPDDGLAPLPMVLPLTGIIQRMGDGSVQLTMTTETQQLEQITPIEGVTSPEIPFELPTFGAETAGVLFTLTPDELAVGLSYGWTLFVNGSPASCIPDFNGDGELDFFDISAFLTAFSASDPAADLTGDGALDFFDISAFLTAFAAGCP
ncbi:MAG: hypothetical protein JKY43_03440 [Phycisphaerales bacterium]|nr:hypothetical protein [Phycisphaerales bacterium]